MKQDSFKLKRTQNFIKKLVHQSAKTILTKKAKIEESLKEIKDEKPSIEQLQAFSLGQDLQLFANLCTRDSSLIEIEKATQSLLDELKKNVILTLFGNAEPISSKPSLNNKEDSMSLHSNLEKEISKHSIKEQLTEEQPKEITIEVKEPAIMLVVCKEIVDLLKKVYNLIMNIEVNTKWG
jgi:hypothetical protein